MLKRLAAGGLSVASLVFLSGCGPEGESPALALDMEGPGLSTLERPDTPGNGLQFNFEPGDLVEAFGSTSGKFLVHFTRNGMNAVPPLDADGSGVPDFVEQVASVYDDVEAHYDSMGFRAPVSDEGLPDNGGDGRFDVYLVDFAGIGDGTFQTDHCDTEKTDICSGYMVQENDYKGYGYPSTLVANRILGSHELFHGVQAAYDREQGSIFNEGTAVWATEAFDSSLNDFEAFIDGYLDNPDRSLDVPLPGPVDPFSYGSAIFFQFLEERYGAGAVRSLMERTEDGAFGVADPKWKDNLDPTLEALAQVTFPEALVEFATWNLFTQKHADPARGYKSGAAYAPVAMNNVPAPHSELLRVFYASTQYYRVDPAGRAQMEVKLVTPLESAQDDTAGLMRLLTVERNGKYEAVETIKDLSASTLTAMDGADAFLVAIVNTALSGNSRRPTLCIGSPEEVEACRVAVQGSSSEASGSGSGGSSGGTAEESGGCSIGSAPSEPGMGVIGLVLGWAYRRARRARRREEAIRMASAPRESDE